MDTSRWERISAFTGLVFVALIGIGMGLAPLRPDLSDQAALVNHVTTERTALLWQGYLGVVGVMFLIWFAGTVRTHLFRNEGSTGRLAAVSYGGAITFGAVLTSVVVVNTTAAFRPSPTSIVFLSDIAAVSFALGWIPVAVWTGATAIATVRVRALPMWHAVLGGIVAIAALLMPALLFADGGGFFSVNEIGATVTMFALLGVWATATSLLLILGEAATAEEIPQPHEGWHLRKAIGM